MKYITLLITLFMTSSVWAHTDHGLGDGALHAIYHAVFWTLFILVAYKGVAWYKSKKQDTKHSK